MKINTASKSTLFLIEFIVVVFLLILTVGVTVGLFMKSHEVAVDSKDLVCSGLIAQSVAEEISGGKESAPLRYFNEEGRESSQGIYKVTMENKEQDNIKIYQIHVFRNHRTIYDLEVQRYLPEEEKNEQ